jgi:hypothetical protein
MKIFNHSLKFLIVVLASFLGGMVSQTLFNAKCASAQGQQTLSTERLYFVGPDGRDGGQVYFSNGSGAIMSLNAENGKQRIQIGTYNEQGEKGLPFIGLWDNAGALRLLFRLAGSNESPVLIFKDRQGSDRIVMGLGLTDAGQEPFIAYTDQHGNKKTLLGTF